MTSEPGRAALGDIDLSYDIDWPAHTTQTLTWSPSGPRGPKADRMLGEFEASIPPMIAGLDLPGDFNIMAAVVAIVRLDQAEGRDLGALSTLLMRTEAVSSSRIERVSASTDDFARAVGGNRSNISATAMVAASRAIMTLVDGAGSTGAITVDDLLAAHALLMADDPGDGMYAGMIRPMQNWVGGSHHSPREALYVPPPPHLVRPLLDDLAAFVGRDDIDPIVQAAIAHAQFESIHPFTDGNGRIGRALISAILRRRGITVNVVVPIASALVANRERYFELLGAYRTGRALPFVRHLARSARVAALEAREATWRLREIMPEWESALEAREGSAVRRMLPLLMEQPIFTAEDVERLLGISPAAAFQAVIRLEEVGIVHEVTGRTRGRVFVATRVIDEIAELERRIASATPGPY